MQSSRRKKEESDKQPQLALELPAAALGGQARKAGKAPKFGSAAQNSGATGRVLPSVSGIPAGASPALYGKELTPAAEVIHVFVDFENICEVDTSIFDNQRVHFTLLVGANQPKLEVGLVEQLVRHAPSVQFVRLTSRGKNALDFTLAYYVGRAVASMPLASFHIISKDKGFDPLVEHLSANMVKIRRHDNFSDVVPKPPVARRAAPPQLRRREDGTLQNGAFEKAVEYLSRASRTRPKTVPRLLRWLGTSFEGHLTPLNAEVVLKQLLLKKFVLVSDSGVVSYSLPEPGRAALRR